MEWGKKTEANTLLVMALRHRCVIFQCSMVKRVRIQSPSPGLSWNFRPLNCFLLGFLFLSPNESVLYWLELDPK